MLVVEREMMPIKANGEMQEGEEDEECGDEDRSLERTASGERFGEIAEFGEEPGAE